MKAVYKTTQAQRDAAKANYYKNRERKLVAAAEYRDQNRDTVNAYFRTDERKTRRNALRRAWNEANRDKQRAVNERTHLLRYHGLTVEEHAEMVAAQQGRCAICSEAPTGKAHCGKLHVDHDHATGQMRDLLCANCNRGLGLFADSPARLAKAAMYLERHAKARHSA